MNTELTKKGIKLTEDTERYLNEVSKITPGSSLGLLIAKGRLLIQKTDLLISDLEKAAEDKEIELTALQLAEALRVNKSGILDVIESLKEANNVRELVEAGTLELKIQSIKERLS